MIGARRPRRLVHLAWIATRWACDRLTARWPGRRAEPGPERFRRLLEELGGTFIKLGQMLALQPDILPRTYCNALFDLLDRVEPFDSGQVERVFREELGCPPAELFDEFEPRPLASASIGQVHLATLGGRRLAVKVRRPTIERDFALDLRLMGAVARLIQRLRLRRLEWLRRLLGEFAAWTAEELDYRCEARHMERLARNARDNPRERVPVVLRDLSTRRVLVMDFIDGVALVDHLRALEEGGGETAPRLAALAFDPEVYAENLISNFLGDVFEHGAYHADLHPANLFICEDNVVGYVDFGISGGISRQTRRHLVAMSLAYARGDVGSMFDHFLELCAVPPHARPDAFRRGLDELAGSWFDLTPDVTGTERVRHLTNFTQVILDMTRLSHRTALWPREGVLKYLRAVVAADGVITRFAPGFDLGRVLGDFCRRFLEQDRLDRALAHPRMLEGLEAALHLLRDGLPRAVRALDRLTAPNTEAVRHGEPDPPETRRGTEGVHRGPRRVVHLAAFDALLAILMAWHPAPAWGLNVFTAEACLLLLGIAALFHAVWQTLRGTR